MSEQTIQDNLYSIPVQFDKYTCRSLGATTIKNLVENKEISGLTIRQCNNIKAKKPDVLVLNRNKEIVIFIEMKTPEEFRTQDKKNAAKSQELSVAKKTKAKIFIISDGETFIWFNPVTEKQILDVEGNPVLKKINPKNLSLEEKKSLADFIDDVCYCIDNKNDQIIPKDYVDPTPLAKKTARIMQNMSLSSAKNSLYTFVEMFTFKFLSDIGVLEGIYCFDTIYDTYVKQSAKDSFKQYLTTVREKLLELFPIADDNTTIINGRLFHTQIDQKGNPIIIDSAADGFGKLLECFHDYEKEHGKFLYINKDFKSKLFETFMKNSSDKDGMGQFFTPLKVVKEMVKMVDIRQGMDICDPACGVGKFLLEASLQLPNTFYFENGELKKKLNLYGFEKRMEDNNDDLTTILAKSNLLLFYSDMFKDSNGDSERIKKLANELLNTVIKSSHSTLGTLETLIPEKYDLILANPPYYQSATITEASKAIKIAGDNKDGENQIDAYTTGGRGIEALFTEWIIKSLKKDGEANVILPDGIFTNIANTNLKQLILHECYIESIISLPVGTFFNTPKKTFILTLHKRNDDENQKQPYPVFAYLCSTIGETLDVYRFDDVDNNDLKNATDLYKIYKSGKTNPMVNSLINDNPRAKLIDIDFFGTEDNWDINLQWSDVEKENLGIKRKDNIMTADEFDNYVTELIEDIKDYSSVIISQSKGIKFKQVRPIDLFNPKNGNSKYTKEFCQSHIGEIPLYSGNTEGAFGYVDSFDYDGEYLTWAKDGLAGYIMIHNGKFALTGHRGILIPKESCKNIHLKYIKYVLESVFRANKKGREGDLGKNEYTTLNSYMIKNMKDTIPIPVQEDGSFDLEQQKMLALKYEKIDKRKKELIQKVSKLININVTSG